MYQNNPGHSKCLIQKYHSKFLFSQLSDRYKCFPKKISNNSIYQCIFQNPSKFSKFSAIEESADASREKRKVRAQHENGREAVNQIRVILNKPKHRNDCRAWTPPTACPARLLSGTPYSRASGHAVPSCNQRPPAI